MLFQISCTSGKWPPCEEGCEALVPHVDMRCVDNPTKLAYYKGRPDDANRDWYSEGTNHRVVEGNICRDLGMKTIWLAEIASLVDLIDFSTKYGRAIIYSPEAEESDSEYPELEIYDDYRE